MSTAGDVNGDGVDDLLIGADGADPNGERSGAGYVVFGQAAAPVPPVTCNGLPATLVGTFGNDTLFGTPGNDVIHGRGGNDILRGLGGGHVIYSGAGDDRLFGKARTSSCAQETTGCSGRTETTPWTGKGVTTINTTAAPEPIRPGAANSRAACRKP